MNLTPDTKYLVASKLSGKDLIYLCSTDSEMRKICYGDKFNPIWQKNIKDDFGIDYDGKNAYMEYMQQTYVYRKKFWIALFYDTEGSHIMSANIYQTYDDALGVIVNDIEENKKFSDEIPPSYPVIKAHLKLFDSITFLRIRYEITFAEFKNYKNPLSSQEEIYQKQLDELANIAYGKFEEGKNDIKDGGTDLQTRFEDLRDDIKDDVQSALDEAVESGFSFDKFWGIFSDYPAYQNHPNLPEIKDYLRNYIGDIGIEWN